MIYTPGSAAQPCGSWAGPGKQFPPRHRMSINSRNEGLKRNAFDDVTGIVCQALILGVVLLQFCTMDVVCGAALAGLGLVGRCGFTLL